MTIQKTSNLFIVICYHLCGSYGKFHVCLDIKLNYLSCSFTSYLVYHRYYSVVEAYVAKVVKKGDNINLFSVMLFVSNTGFIDFSFFLIAKKFFFNGIFINTTTFSAIQ